MNENNILGVVLAGGKSERFGEDKTSVEDKLYSRDLILNCKFVEAAPRYVPAKKPSIILDCRFIM